ncbi:MAG: hypothetical protein AB7F96_21080 [Beijerinckiaceae bacterium]
MSYRSALYAGFLSAFLSTVAHAQQEPFGQNIGVWKFTQAPDKAKVVCRAFSPGPFGVNIIGRTGAGKFYVSVPAQGIPKGMYEGADLAIGGQHEPLTATSDGSRFVLPVDDQQIARIIRARGYQWAAMVRGQRRSGAAAFDSSVGAAVKRLRECTKANGGR